MFNRCCAIFIIFTLGLCSPLLAYAFDDPTCPPTVKKAKPSAKKASPPQIHWLLSSTLIADNRRSAVLNGTVISVGERINNATVKEILPGKVILLMGKKSITVMIENSVKKTVCSENELSTSENELK